MKLLALFVSRLSCEGEGIRGQTSAKLPSLCLQVLDHVCYIFFLRFQHRFDFRKLRLELNVLLGVHYLRRFADYGL